MPEPTDPLLKRAVAAVTPDTKPDFAAVYARSGRRFGVRWAGLGLSVAAAAALVVILGQPAPAPAFEGQVAAFVDLVYSE